MWSLIGTIIGIIAKLLGVGAPDPVAQGERLGQAETKAQSDDKVLSEVRDAEAARRDVGVTPDQLRGPDPFSRT